MGFYYVDTPGQHVPIQAVLRKCHRLHADRVAVVDGEEIPLYGEPERSMASSVEAWDN